MVQKIPPAKKVAAKKVAVKATPKKAPAKKALKEAAVKPIPATAVEPVVKPAKPARAKDADFGFGELFCFTHPYGRQRYWGVVVCALAINITVTVLFFAFPPFILLVIPVGMVLWWVRYATTIKRLRDMGVSLWWALLSQVPLAGFVSMVAFGCIEANEDKNRRPAGWPVFAGVMLGMMMFIVPAILAGIIVKATHDLGETGEGQVQAEAAPAVSIEQPRGQ